MRSLPFSVRRRFINLPDEVTDVMYDKAFARAQFLLKCGCVAGALISASIYVFFEASAISSGSFQAIGELVSKTLAIAGLSFTALGLSLSRCVLDLASRGVLTSFAASLEHR